jgi:hypothetical protein
VETGTGVSESLLTSAESSEVGGGLGDNVVEELEGDLASGGTVDGDIEKDLAIYTKSKEVPYELAVVLAGKIFATVAVQMGLRLTTYWIELKQQSFGW